jgi:hypothetical protein
LAKRKEHLSQEYVKIRILAYLYNRPLGANSYTIQHRASIPLQEFNRFRGFLEDLCQLDCLKKQEEETSSSKRRINYIITEKGKDIVNKYRDPFIQEIFGTIDDLCNVKGDAQ